MKIITQEIETRTGWWAAIGPLLLLLTLSVTTWVGRAPFLPLISLISLPLATLWGKRGLAVGCAFLLINCFAEPTLWSVGAMASAACALLVSHVAYDEVRLPFQRMRHDRTSLEEEFGKLRAEYLDYRRAAEHEMRIERVKIRELGALQAERNALLAELFEIRCTTPDHALRQLRQQFEEKGEILHATRDELWHAESKSLRLEHEQANAALEPDPHFDALAAPLEAVAHAEEEIEALENVIAKLLDELKSRSVPSLSGFQLPTQ